ncbi:hypothetical protein BDZ89DRAFT_1073911 [Hymenopellis radicata]|nr:hypothetical protein BDZ89DRAFT_1073911 [Hymenopellis radicata]
MSISSDQTEPLVDTMQSESDDRPTTIPNSIRSILLNSIVPKFHNTRDVAASTMSLDVFGPPLTPTPTGSKRSATMISNDTDASLYAMHLAPNLQIDGVESFPDLPVHLVESIWKYPSIDVQIPSRNNFSPSSMQKKFKAHASGRGQAIESIGDLKAAHHYRESMAATFSSVLVGNSSSVETSGFLKWTESPRNLYPGSAEALAGGYVSIDPSLPRVSPSMREMLQMGIDAIQRFRLSDIQVTDFQAICAPLDGKFPLWAVEQFARQRLKLTSLTCKGKDDRHCFCGSDRCTVDMDRLSPRSGRPTGVDGDPALKLVANCDPAVESFEASFSDELKLLWAKAVAVDATFIILTGGNLEIICLRVRGNQTLYISDILPVDRQPFPSTTHIGLHTGINIAAFNDAISRGRKNMEHMEAGTLPSTFRQTCIGEIDLYNSTLGFAELSSLLEPSVGKFLPTTVSGNPESFDAVHCRFLRAAQVQISWDEDDDLKAYFVDAGSPLTLESLTPGAITLHVKIHCEKAGGWRAFLCHFINDDEAETPYGKPLLMKIAWNDAQVEIVDENNHLSGLEDCSEYISSRVPKMYGVFSGEKDGNHFTACFMEHCDGYYPLAIADNIDDDLEQNIREWVDRLHKEAKIAHTGLGDSILFNPSNPGSFYVVGWTDATKKYKPWQKQVDNNAVDSLIKRVRLRKSPDIIPPKKKAKTHTQT